MFKSRDSFNYAILPHSPEFDSNFWTGANDLAVEASWVWDGPVPTPVNMNHVTGIWVCDVRSSTVMYVVSRRVTDVLSSNPTIDK